MVRDRSVPGAALIILRLGRGGWGLVDRNRPARYEVGGRAALKATGQAVEILEVRRGEFVPDFVYKVRVLAERPARPYNLSVPEHDLSDLPV
jgi:hypothetical protein